MRKLSSFMTIKSHGRNQGNNGKPQRVRFSNIEWEESAILSLPTEFVTEVSYDFDLQRGASALLVNQFGYRADSFNVVRIS